MLLSFWFASPRRRLGGANLKRPGGLCPRGRLAPRDRGPEADTKASLAMPTIGGRAGFAGTTVLYCWEGH